jgi:hypothetical protein
MHCGVEITRLGTNKQQISLTLTRGDQNGIDQDLFIYFYLFR